MTTVTADHMRAVARLAAVSRREHHSPFTRFDWPDAVPTDIWWMNPEYTTAHGTERQDDPRCVTLSQAETVNFFSLHVHGIRELMGEVAFRIHTPRFAPYSEYMHHFLGEENNHMWYFAEFCNRYWTGVYPPISVPPIGSTTVSEVWSDFIVFSRILIFEEVFDYYNARLGREASLPEIIREIHAAHHHDESRHVAFGKKLVADLFVEADAESAPADKDAAAAYVRNYIRYSINSLYNPRCYSDAGFDDVLTLRRSLLNDPARVAVHHDVMNRIDTFYRRLGLYDTPWDER